MKTDIVITKIEWERIFLHIYIDSSEDREMGFYNKPSKKFIVIKPTKEDNCHFEINMTCVHNRAFLDNGNWQFGYFEEDVFIPSIVSTDVAYQYDVLSRIFRYGKKNQYAYTVSFDVIANEDNAQLYFLLRSYFMKTNRGWKKRNYAEEGIYTHKTFQRLFFALKCFVINVIYRFFCLFSRKKGKNIMLMSETKPFINGNLLALDNKLKETKLCEEYKITYSFRKTIGNNQSIFNWIKVLFKLSKQDYVFIDDFAPIFNYLNLSKKTKLIQLWHAGAGFKAVGYCRFGKNGSPFPNSSVHKKYDYGIVGAEELIKVFEEVWSIDKESILPLGMARLDNYLDEEKKKKVVAELYETYPKLKNKKVILFAPTYRGTGQKKAHYDYEKLDLKRIYDFCKKEYVFVFKMHPFIVNLPPIPEEYQDRLFDLSDYHNINDLYYIADMMITDYSSSYYEFSLMKKPILFYTYDRSFYEISRGVYQGIKESAPGKVCDTFEELMYSLEHKDYELEKTLKYERDNFNNMDNKASERILNKILNIGGKK